MRNLHKVKNLEIKKPTFTIRQEKLIKWIQQAYPTQRVMVRIRPATSYRRASTLFYRESNPYNPIKMYYYMDYDYEYNSIKVDWSRVVIERN